MSTATAGALEPVGSSIECRAFQL